MLSKFKKGILLVFLTTIFTAIGQILFKYSSESFSLTIEGFILNYPMWLGLFLYGLGLIVLILGLREGELTNLYPILSLSFIWVLIGSVLIFNEPLTILNVLGTAVIGLGVSVIAFQPRKEVVS